MEDGEAEDGGDGYEHYTPRFPDIAPPPPSLVNTHIHAAACQICMFPAAVWLGFKGKQKEGINVLTIVALHNIDTPKQESRTSHSWIACTIDVMFLEKLALRSGHRLNFLRTKCCATIRPGLQPVIKEPYARRPTYRLSTWIELDCILQLDADSNGVVRASRIVPSLGVGGHVGHQQQ
ncbi:hypothetical protein EDB87DRAFT_1692390 [Lactarius vividus]|nr:hypothetical protein EDB87DRAFT_1692390 [Lactarius vividus]